VKKIRATNQAVYADFGLLETARERACIQVKEGTKTDEKDDERGTDKKGYMLSCFSFLINLTD
jgi:hypothetical protein